MDKAKRKAIIAGNWKMNKTASEAAVLVDELVPAVQDAGCEVVICTPYTDLVTAVEKTKGTNIHVGAENVHFEKSGAFTGEISADMLVDLGVEYVIVGHSERRQYFAETDQTVNKRALAALNAGLKVIICVGESLQQREEGVTEELVRMQTKIALRDVTAEPVVSVAVHAAGAHQAHQMDGLAGVDGSLHVLDQNRVLEHLTVLDGLGDQGQLLVHDASCTHVGVAHLRVAHLAVGQADCHAGSLDGGHGVFCHQSIQMGGLGGHHGIAVGLARHPAEAIHDAQKNRFLCHKMKSPLILNK